ncbi:uncharacterized protein [Ranitomeya imitator]|uniref:uncharacterized protein n=1 Tax=Ranitomeya imitator TaxID=111125 RepID=UPI0037E86B0C
MDYRNRDATWQVQAAQVFDGDATNLMTGVQGDVSGLQTQIKRLLHKRTRMWWNRALLENYLKKKIIPRGLRIQVFPSFPVSDENFITKWEEVCTKSSLQFMELLIELNKKSVLAVEVEIDELFGSLKEVSSVENLTTFNTSMDKNSDEWEKQIKTIHAKKISRDNNDYQQGTVYRWRNNGTRRQRSVSFSSVSSSGDTSDTSHPMKTRFGNDNKRKKEQRTDANKRIPGPNPRSDSLKVINLSDHVFSNEEIEVLSKGLTFSPSTRCDKFTVIKDLHVFGRSLLFKKWYHSEEIQKLFPLPSEQAALRTLEELAVEHQGPSLGQFLRIKRICSDTSDFEIRAEEMKARFLERGYSKRSIKRAYNRARNTDRHQLLYAPKKKELSNEVRFYNMRKDNVISIMMSLFKQCKSEQRCGTPVIGIIPIKF